LENNARRCIKKQTNNRKKNRNKYREVEILSAQYERTRPTAANVFLHKQTQLLRNRLSGILGHDGVDHLHFIHHSLILVKSLPNINLYDIIPTTDCFATLFVNTWKNSEISIPISPKHLVSLQNSRI